ncbi:MAG: amidohydrolase, partial [Comamonadaceae bacterium]
MSGAPMADRILRGGKVLTLAGGRIAQAVAIRGDAVVAVGTDRDVSALAGPATAITELAGRTLMPGLIDGHAHADREGLKGLLPSLSGCRSVAAVVERIRGIAAGTPKARWIVTMPLGEPPEYAFAAASYGEGRLPDRHDLDAATGDHPVLVRCAWGYWPG